MQRSAYWIFALVIATSIAGCGETDERLYGKWEGQISMNWGGRGNTADAGMSGEQRESMEAARAEARERMADRKFVLEFDEDGKWNSSWGEGGGGGMITLLNGEGTYSITEKDNNDVTLSLQQDFYSDSTLKLRFDNEGMLQIVEYDQSDRIEFGKLSKQ